MNNSTVCVIGLGFVGLPMAELCAKKNHTTYGLDVDKIKINSINAERHPSTNKKLENKIIASTDYKIVKDCEIIIICVPTPLGSDKKPDLTILKATANSLAPYIRKNHLIILESTVNPGVTEDIIIKAIEKDNLKTGEDFFVAHCPERIDTGNKIWTIENLPRVLGACSEKSLKKALEFYKTILTSEVMPLSSIKTAEAVKIYENTFRDVNIALSNNCAKAFQKTGIDFIEIIKGAATKPFGFMPFYPGPGIGGTCIPMSATYLIEWLEKEGMTLELVKVARKINDSMPSYVVNFVIKEMEKAKLSITNTKIGILGLSYKGGVPDTRDSPSYPIIKNLQEKNVNLLIFDPYVPNESTVDSISQLLEECQCLLLLTDHPEFKNINIEKTKLIIDTKNFLDKPTIEEKQVIYKSLGRSI